MKANNPKVQAPVTARLHEELKPPQRPRLLFHGILFALITAVLYFILLAIWSAISTIFNLL